MTRTTLIALTLSLAACTTEFGNGVSERQTMPLSAVQALENHTLLDVQIRVEPGEDAITLTCDENLLGLLTTDVVDGTLMLEVKPGHNIQPRTRCTAGVVVSDLQQLAVFGSGSVEVDEALHSLTQLVVTGSGSAQLTETQGELLEVTVTGSGSAELGHVDADHVRTKVTGSGSLSLAGAASTLDGTLTGSGSLDAQGLLVDVATLALSGSGQASITANEQATISITGSGGVSLFGTAQLDATTTGSGEVTRR